MPLTKKGTKIMKAMSDHYGAEKGKQVFYASKKEGKIKGVEGKSKKKPSAKKKAQAVVAKATGKPFASKY